ncbi:MAG: hypothetical protein WCI76_01480 [bacterium]
MDRKKLTKVLAYLISIIFFIQLVATKLAWYSLIWWFDMPVHFLGGLWLGLLFIYIFGGAGNRYKYIFRIISLVFLCGIGWEFFEFYFVNHLADNPFNLLDTISDLCFDLAGGCFAILYFFRRIMLQLS